MATTTPTAAATTTRGTFLGTAQSPPPIRPRGGPLKLWAALLVGVYTLTFVTLGQLHRESSNPPDHRHHHAPDVPATAASRPPLDAAGNEKRSGGGRSAKSTPAMATIEGGDDAPPRQKQKQQQLEDLLSAPESSSSSSSFSVRGPPPWGREKLQTKLDRIHEETGRPYDGDALWELSDYVPPWMKEYFEWHKRERRRLDDAVAAGARWDDSDDGRGGGARLMVMQCLRGHDTVCGGTADRLKPFLRLVREAHEMGRLLLIHWTVPARIEEFLVPPVGGVDWRAPKWLEPVLYDGSVGRKLFKQVDQLWTLRNSSVPLFRTRFQSVSGFADHYDAMAAPGEASFADVYHDVWRIFFRPSPPVARIVEEEMGPDLRPGTYAAAHLRALYGRRTSRTDDEATHLARNALNCASQLRPGGPFLFASDHTYSATAALLYGVERGVAVYARRHEAQPLHLEKAPAGADGRRPEEFYDTFVDLYLMGMSRCLTYNRGGFGHWALLIGYDAACFINQKTTQAGIAAPCNWTEPAAGRPGATAAPETGAVGVPRRKVPLFLDPMP